MPKAKLVQQVFESRYERGYRYLDRCGEVMLILEAMLPDETNSAWMPDAIAPTGAKLKCPDLDLYLAFDSYRLVIDQNPVSGADDSSEQFSRLANLVHSTITARFDIREFVRVGYRRWALVATDTVEEAESLSTSVLPLRNWPRAPIEGEKTLASEAVTVVEDSNGSGYRFAVGPYSRVEAPLEADPRLRMSPRLQDSNQRHALIEQLKRQALRQKTPLAGVMFDVDCYKARPEKIAVDEFISASVKQAESLVAAIAPR